MKFVFGLLAITTSAADEPATATVAEYQKGLAELKAGARALRNGRRLCDEHEAEEHCVKKSEPPKTTSRICRWRVMKGQLFKVINPNIYENNIGATCNWADYPAAWMWQCEQCIAKHQPCGNEHMACGGCDCQHPDLPEPIAKYLAELHPKIHHTCEEIKDAFKNPNYFTVACEEGNASAGEDDGSAGEDLIAAERVDLKPQYNDSVFLQGLFEGGCTTHPSHIPCARVPFILKFECDDCGNKGSPRMLKQCCEKCKKWVDGLSKNKLIPATTLPLGFCSGCDAENITFEDSQTPQFPPMEWKHHVLFEDYTERKAIQRYDEAIEINVCSKLAPHCDSPSFTEQHHPAECHSGYCEAQRRLESSNTSESCENSTFKTYRRGISWTPSRNRNSDETKESIESQNASQKSMSSAVDGSTTEENGCNVFNPIMYILISLGSVLLS